MKTDCNQPRWEIRVDFTALGAPGYEERDDVQGCQDFCIFNLSCVGVDVDRDFNPKRCWWHYNEDDFRESNIYSQAGTTSYQLISRCAES